MVKVSRRGGFSDRQGIKSENTEIQLKDLDTRTRTQIYNLLSCFLASNFPHFHRYDFLKSALYIHAVSKNINTFPKKSRTHSRRYRG